MPVTQGGCLPAQQGMHINHRRGLHAGHTRGLVCQRSRECPLSAAKGVHAPSHIPLKHVNHLLELQSLRVLAYMWSVTRAWLAVTCSTVQSSLAGLAAALMMTSQTYVAKRIAQNCYSMQEPGKHESYMQCMAWSTCSR